MTADDSNSLHVLQLTSLEYPENMRFDSNTLLFYAMRSQDTSTLILLKHEKKEIRGVAYMILPEFEFSPGNFRGLVNKLLFFDGYSFIIDSLSWLTVINQARKITAIKDSLTTGPPFYDGASYAVYFDQKSKTGNSNHPLVFEQFDTLIRKTFMDSFREMRKPTVTRLTK